MVGNEVAEEVRTVLGRPASELLGRAIKLSLIRIQGRPAVTTPGATMTAIGGHLTKMIPTHRSQSRVGYAADSRCASRLGGIDGYDDTGGGGGGGYLEQPDPRMYCTGGYCMGDTMMGRGICGEELELDMRRHIQACACTCNHMGYGNYMDYQALVHGVTVHITFQHKSYENDKIRPWHDRGFGIMFSTLYDLSMSSCCNLEGPAVSCINNEST
ncbi:hypothetical protein QAD02_014391 [Eretmocerus hayati]|uniref:Uncharacterized protein n=1 Tax=Eretmocerus hayati TaxID=131215 RepID=A0ACC2P7N1_9HYME|nr:hypothetical protein QAD02_014391 [Eretmocerus hayati]